MDKMTQTSQNLTQWYQALPKAVPPKTAFIKEVAARCGVEEYTVKIWVTGRCKPSKEEYMDVLSEITGIPKDQLFPNGNN